MSQTINLGLATDAISTQLTGNGIIDQIITGTTYISPGSWTGTSGNIGSYWSFTDSESLKRIEDKLDIILGLLKKDNDFIVSLVQSGDQDNILMAKEMIK